MINKGAIFPAARIILICALFLAHDSFAAEKEVGKPIEQAVSEAMAKVYPALLYIQPVTEDYSAGRKKNVVSSGSGVIISTDGYALTNYHVAGHAKYLRCTLSNKEQIEATLVGGDPSTDVALIKLDSEKFGKLIGDDFKPAELGNNASVKVGMHVLAMGSPFGYDRSVSLGIISCADRYLEDEATLPTGESTGTYNTWIQTAAATNPGNSGGPLVDLSGKVVGLNARVIFYGNSIGFAIPVDIVKEVKDGILKDGRMRRSWTGIDLQQTVDLEEKFLKKLEGALVRGVVADSPAARAGIKAGDLILEADGKAITVRHRSQLPGAKHVLSNLPINKEITILISDINGENRRQVKLTTTEAGKQSGQDAECPAWGITVKGITKDMARKLKVPVHGGVMVFGVQAGSPAGMAGLKYGDVIYRVENITVKSFSDFSNAYGASTDIKAPALVITAYRGKSLQYILIKPNYQSE
ncbi:MAG: trypsin-like peptidase domain-containing protein [Planctomycetes bacterium]|nr:trypsin-like peptidase domain-containing protein [Planctomycetota bacterium]